MYHSKKTNVPTRFIAALLALLMLVVPGGVSAFADEDGSSGNTGVTQPLSELLALDSYSEYIASNATAKPGSAPLTIEGQALIDAYNASISDAYNNDTYNNELKTYTPEAEGVKAQTGIYLPASGTVGWTIDNVPSEGLYTIELTYLSFPEQNSKTTSIERTLYINGKVPFYEARFLSMTKVWTDKQDTFQLDPDGNVIYKYQKDNKVVEPYVDKDGNILELDLSTGKMVFKKTGKTVDEAKLLADGCVKYPVYNNDINKNEIKTDKVEISEWRTYTCSDSTGYHIDAFQFFFNEGTNTIQLEAQREAMVLYSIKLVPYSAYSSYADYVDSHSDAEVIKDGKSYKVQAEYPSATSENTIYATNDRTSFITEPQDASQLLLNVIGGNGGEKWQTVGQWVRYTINVEKTGMYQISLRYKQSVNEGTFASRTVKIATNSMIEAGQSAQVPFYEAQYVQFNYDDDWQSTALNDGTTTFLFYLEEGTNYIELEASLGNMADILRRVEDTMVTVNDIYLKILMITGSEPDSNRDYGFYRIMPDEIDELLVQSDNLYDIAAEIEKMTNTTGSSVATLEKIALLLYRMGLKESNIAKNLGNLKENLGTLGTWLQQAKYQPLEIDYVVVEPSNVNVEKTHKAKDNIFQSIWFEVVQFFRSFVADYNTLGAMEVVDDENVVEVWTTLGRDQAQIIRNLINSDFNKNNPGVSINFKLVAGGSLLPSVLAGVGPDVSMGHGAGDVINWAIRSAVVPLNDMEGIEEVVGKYDPVDGYQGIQIDEKGDFVYDTAYFTKSAIVPLELFAEYEDGTQEVLLYGLPETQSFAMMFYRADVFQQLGLQPPSTWGELIAMLPELQRNNMEVALPNSLGGLNLFLYQMNGDLYSDNGKKIGIETDTALTAFDYMCSFFSQYRQPYAYDFANRFRTGEIPLGIVDYTAYTQLSVYATEIKGLWEFVPLPAYENIQENGAIVPNNTSVSGVSALIMLHDEKRTPEQTANAWKYMKWFVGAANQSAYANELTALLGTVSKHSTANVEALASLSWTTSEYTNLKDQFTNLSAVREYPGGYIIARYVSFAFLSVYNDNADPVDSLLSYVTEINKEITRKRKEFGLSYYEVSYSVGSSDDDVDSDNTAE